MFLTPILHSICCQLLSVFRLKKLKRGLDNDAKPTLNIFSLPFKVRKRLVLKSYVWLVTGRYAVDYPHSESCSYVIWGRLAALPGLGWQSYDLGSEGNKD